MKGLIFPLLAIALTFGCTNQKEQQHISFLSVPIDGSVNEFLYNIQTNSTNEKGCFSDKLGLQVDSVNYEKKKFYCSLLNQEELMDLFMMEYEAFWSQENNKVGYIRGMTLMTQDLLRIFKVSLYESLGHPTYVGLVMDESDKTNWNKVERSLFSTMSQNFIAWKLPNGYVVFDDEATASYPGYSIALMLVVDNENYCDWLMSEQ